MMFDSDVVIWQTRGSLEAAAWIDSSPDRAISIVTVMEILQGSQSKVDMRNIQQSLHDMAFRIVPLTERIGATAADLIEAHALSDGLRLEDALIAATAIEAGKVLATSNVRHFRAIRGLEVRAFRPHVHRSH
jgi:predicted nucleic acid-binding protein